MIATMRKAPGVGLAAPQIGDPRRIIVLEDRQEYMDTRMEEEEINERQRFAFPLRIIINPKLTPVHSGLKKHTATFTEGCLSVNGYVGDVERDFEVKVEGYDENANFFEWQVAGWPARILQHEVDHLNGLIYIDRMDRRTFRTIKSSQEFQLENELPTIDSSLEALSLIRPLGDPILRRTADSVDINQIRSPELQAIISKMVNVMHKIPLVGMAAPQIGIPLRIIVLEDKEKYILESLSPKEQKKFQRYSFPLKIIINPKLIFTHPLSASFPEGNPCIPGYLGSVERKLEVTVTGFDESGSKIEWSTTGWPARILQHEVDHLDGILYIDRMNTKTFQAVE